MDWPPEAVHGKCWVVEAPDQGMSSEKENDEDGRQAGSGLSPVVVPQPCVSESRSGRGNGAAARRVYFRAS